MMRSAASGTTRSLSRVCGGRPPASGSTAAATAKTPPRRGAGGPSTSAAPSGRASTLSGRFGRGVDAMKRTTNRRSLGRQFGWLWTAYAVSTLGTWVAFDAFPLIAILALHAGPTEVSALAAAGLAVAAVVAVPLGPWVEFRRKRTVMMAMAVTRFAALLTVPVAYALGCLTFAQLVVVSVAVGAAGSRVRSASGAFVKHLVAREDLLVANARFEATSWTATVLGPPMGGAAFS